MGINAEYMGIYTGSTTIKEADLASFLKLGTDLKVQELYIPPEKLIPVQDVTDNNNQVHNNPEPVPNKDIQVQLDYQHENQNHDLDQDSFVCDNQVQIGYQHENHDQDQNQDSFVCEICHGIFKTRKILTKHKLKHSDIKFPCEECGKQFGRK